MVLQRAPDRANVWGYVNGCKAVEVTFNSAKINATLTSGLLLYSSVCCVRARARVCVCGSAYVV